MKKIIAIVIALVMVVAMLPTTVFALSGTAEYEPAESNISGKYWVTFSANEGDAALAADGDLNTAWTWTSYPAVLTVDLGGTYDAVRKIETVFADSASVYKYKIEGSTDGETWAVLADRTGNDAIGANYTDIFAFEGLRYVKLTVESAYIAGVKEFKVINYLREDMNNGSDSSTVSWSNSYYYNAGNNPPVDGVRGGKLEAATMENGNNFFGLVKDLGWDTTRLRVWNEPRSEGDWRYAADLNEAISANWPAASNSNTSCSPDAQAEYAKYIVGAGQKLAIDFHYSDSWSDPQNQPKPYAWAELSFEELVDTVYDFTYDYIKRLIDQDTAPSIVAIGNEITNGMMWGSEYLEVNEFADYHDYYKRFIRDNSPENMNANGTTIDGSKINPDATEGGGVKWVKYKEANGNKNSPEYKEFLDSINNLARLVDAGNRAIAALNEEYDLDIQTEMHFAFNVIEQPRNGDKVVLDEDYVFNKVTTLVSNLAEDLESMGGMVDRIGVSYYPDWHGTYDTVQRNIVELSKMLPDVEFNIAECSPAHSGSVNSPLDNPNYPVGTRFTPQLAGDIAIEIMKVINDVPNNAGQGVWPWNGQSVYGTGSRQNATLQASFKAWNDAFAKNVVESNISVATAAGEAPVLPATVKSLDVATGEITDVAVTWDAIDASAYAETGTFTVSGVADVTVPEAGRGKAMNSVTATVVVLDELHIGAVIADTLTTTCGDGKVATVDVNYVGTSEISSVTIAIDSELPITEDDIESDYAVQYNEDNGYLAVWEAEGGTIDGTLFTINYDLDVYPWYANGEYEISIDVIDATGEDLERAKVIAVDGAVILDNDYEAGDANLDGIVTNADVVTIAKYLVKLVELDAEQMITADFDVDGEIDNSDLVKLAKAVVGA